MDMNDLIDESIGSRDMLQSQTIKPIRPLSLNMLKSRILRSGTWEGLVDEEVKKTIEEIPSKFGQTADKYQFIENKARLDKTRP